MKKSINRILIFIGVLLLIYKTLGLFGVIKRYNNATTANEPNFHQNQKFFISNIVNPEKGDFIAYKSFDSILGLGEHIRIHRLVGKEGDIIEIKEGTLYINNLNYDDNLDLMHCYNVSSKEYLSIKKMNFYNPIVNIGMPTSYNGNKVSNIRFALKDKIADSIGLSKKIAKDSINHIDKQIQKVYNKEWNKDNFGPLIITKNKLFVIGDNRDNSEDSRYSGLIDLKDLVGVKI